MKSTVSEKGQVTISKPLRDSRALVPGTKIEFEERDGVLVVRPVVSGDPLSHLVGLLPRTTWTPHWPTCTGGSWNSIKGPVVGAVDRTGRLVIWDRGFYRRYLNL